MPFKRSFQEGKICATASKHCMAHQGACSLFSHSAITFHHHKKSPQKTEKRRVCHSVRHKSGSGPHFKPSESGDEAPLAPTGPGKRRSEEMGEEIECSWQTALV